MIEAARASSASVSSVSKFRLIFYLYVILKNVLIQFRFRFYFFDCSVPNLVFISSSEKAPEFIFNVHVKVLAFIMKALNFNFDPVFNGCSLWLIKCQKIVIYSFNLPTLHKIDQQSTNQGCVNDKLQISSWFQKLLTNASVFPLDFIM